ncbi:cell division protein SepF [Ruminiclostridium hungatei]|uniref:Cell division protein SepF n=1 Tax=Ruminiclostridium hungatei TaxID=48256 RepID=A0A1V4SIE2_RUMHU|nr:cell division protein SepF [Ruminiclostridium hungatei]OPX43235.1 cell division protein SepF [Ruminiclostridium hungatei]
MSKLLNKVFNFVGWEAIDEEEDEDLELRDNDFKDDLKSEPIQTHFFNNSKKQQAGKVVNIHSANQFKMVVSQPTTFDDAQDICDHLKSKKPVVINLEGIEKSDAQRIIDFLSGSIYALDGSIQKVSCDIFVIAPNNVDVSGDLKDELRNKTVFPWAK